MKPVKKLTTQMKVAAESKILVVAGNLTAPIGYAGDSGLAINAD
jgi:hypothetical protein